MFATARRTGGGSRVSAIVAVLVIGCVVVSDPARSRAGGSDRRPNVLIFLTDDQPAQGP